VNERTDVGDLLRQLAPQVLGALLRRYGHWEMCEDAVQEALIELSADWERNGVPAHPRGLLVTVANRRMIDQIRSESARRAREERTLVGAPPVEMLRLPGDDTDIDRDDSLILLFLCCHPALTVPSQIALTLRSVGGLSTKEIAGAFFVPEPTMAQRISRAKQRIQDVGASFSFPPGDELEERISAVHHVLYLIFNEGYTTSSGPAVHRADLTAEAIRLTRALRHLRPHDTETSGLLALMLLTDARRPARLSAEGDLVPLAHQDRKSWDRVLIDEGVGLVTQALSEGPVGPYQLQAAIAAVHDEAETAGDTDWPQVLALYEMLDLVAPNPMATINRAVAVSMVQGPLAGLALLGTVDDDARVANHHLLFAVRGHLLEMAGDANGAQQAFLLAARRTASLPERRYLESRAGGGVGPLRGPDGSGVGAP
jgi:RNA polymerase sigma factor (sigma-70 family)